MLDSQIAKNYNKDENKDIENMRIISHADYDCIDFNLIQNGGFTLC